MASANAMARIACTRIFVAAPGLRPTASAAPRPMKPTPIAAPSAARPTWMLPPITANIGINILFLSLFSTAPALAHGRTAEMVLMAALFVRFFLRANQHREHRRQQHEHQRLDESHEHFHEIKRYRQNNRADPARNQPAHGLEHQAAGEDVPVKTET